MFPFQQGGDLSFQISDSLDNAVISSNNIHFNTTANKYYDPSRLHQIPNANANANVHHNRKNRLVTSSSRTAMDLINNQDQGDVANNKRSIHREIERQRRQEMAKLYSSIRSLLPSDYIRGKRSISDHITEAAKYIKDMERNVIELREKRDKLKSSSSSGSNFDVGCSSATTSSSSSSSSSSTDCNLSIHAFSGAIEIEISTGVVAEEVFPLSKVFRVLVHEGLTVVDCVSSKLNQRWIHVIHCQVSDEISIDSDHLQRRLMTEIGSSYDI